jgi:cytochrome b involved in lipid metabolism
VAPPSTETPPLTKQASQPGAPAAAREAVYFTPAEVSVHNSAGDIWLSWLGKVYDLTPLCQDHAGNPLLMPILKNAGRDVSHWFDPKTRDVGALFMLPLLLLPWATAAC